MKNKNFLFEILLSVLLIGLLLLFLNPFQHFWMPTMGASMMVLAVIIVFIAYAIFFWKEKARDEREEQHKLFAGRFAFITGAALLLAGIIYQSFAHHLDNWLVIVLVGMVVAKIVGAAYSEIRR